jgi:GNAT superfamily N-acetyltransferase
MHRLRNSRLRDASARGSVRRDFPGAADLTMSDRNAGLQVRPGVFRLPGGDAVMVRAIRPHDAERLQDYFRGLSDQSRRNRFLGAVNELPPSEIERLSGLDRPGELMLIASRGDGHDAAVIAEAIHVMTPESAGCEFALSVTDRWQRRGLGTLLMRLIECRARLLGARALFGDVLGTNAAMKCFTRKAGFSLRTSATDARLVEIVKDLTRPLAGPPCDQQFAQLRAIAA